MRITITIDLEEVDEPTFTDRAHDALLRYVASHIDGGQPGTFVYTKKWQRLGTVVDTTTVLRVEIDHSRSVAVDKDLAPTPRPSDRVTQAWRLLRAMQEEHMATLAVSAMPAVNFSKGASSDAR